MSKRCPEQDQSHLILDGRHQMALKLEKMPNLPIMTGATLFSRRTEVKGLGGRQHLGGAGNHTEGGLLNETHL